MLDVGLEIRKLPPSNVRELVHILEYSDSWKRLMEIIPRNLEKDRYECEVGDGNTCKYHSEHFRLIENASLKMHRSCSEILLDEWGTSGRIRPSLGHLLHLLQKAQLYRAADFVAVDLLKREPPERPSHGPAARVHVHFSDSPIDGSYDSSELENYLGKTLENNIDRDERKNAVPKIVITEEVSDMIEFSRSQENNASDPEEGFQSQNTEEVESGPELSVLMEDLGEVPQLSVLLDKGEESGPQISLLLDRGEESGPQISRLLEKAEESGPQISLLLDKSEDTGPQISLLMGATTEAVDSAPQISLLLGKSDDSASSDSPQLSLLLDKVPRLKINDESSEQDEESLPTIPTSPILSGQSRRSSDAPPSFASQRSSRPSCHSPLPNLSLNTLLPHFTYEELETATNNFDETPYTEDSTGRFLGSGAFGSVYLAVGLLDRAVAVKKLHLGNVDIVEEDDEVTKQFRNEVEVLCRYEHPNLLSIRGYSCDGPTYCLMYEYISGGALNWRLEKRKEDLQWMDRFRIAEGTANAVAYLHTAFTTPLIHRDIKTANILLDCDKNPKLGDFGIIKLSPNPTATINTTVIGTSVYMAPEAFRSGDVSPKTDTFSFGVVLLELLTALPPLDENRDARDLISHVDEVCEDDSIATLLDVSAGEWTRFGVNVAEELFAIANRCLEEKKKRPSMVEVRELLKQLGRRIQAPSQS